MIRAMQHRISTFFLGLGAALVATSASAQWAVYEQPTAADWAALAERPDIADGNQVSFSKNAKGRSA